MAGTKAGGKRAVAKIKAYDPGFYARIGAIGGKAGHTGGFFADRDLASKAGARGGTISRRGAPRSVEG